MLLGRVIKDLLHAGSEEHWEFLLSGCVHQDLVLGGESSKQVNHELRVWHAQVESIVGSSSFILSVGH